MLCTRIRHSAGTENLVPEEVNYTKIAIRVTVMNKVQFLLAVLMIPRRLIPESSMLSRTQRLALSRPMRRAWKMIASLAREIQHGRMMPLADFTQITVAGKYLGASQ